MLSAPRARLGMNFVPRRKEIGRNRRKNQKHGEHVSDTRETYTVGAETV